MPNEKSFLEWKMGMEHATWNDSSMSWAGYDDTYSAVPLSNVSSSHGMVFQILTTIYLPVTNSSLHSTCRKFKGCLFHIKIWDNLPFGGATFEMTVTFQFIIRAGNSCKINYKSNEVKWSIKIDDCFRHTPQWSLMALST